MKTHPWITLPALFGAAVLAGEGSFTVPGKTESSPGRVAVIAPAAPEPVAEVLVREGDTVRKDQPLIRLGGAGAGPGGHTITARVAGVVARLSACPGAVARPGAAVWDEVLDPSELDVRCEVTPRQARSLAPGQSAEVREEGGAPAAGRVVLVGVAADPQTGRVPVVIRFTNPANRFRCYVPVSVTFGTK